MKCAKPHHIKKGRPSQVVRVALVTRSQVKKKQYLRMCGEKAFIGLSLPQTPLM